MRILFFLEFFQPHIWWVEVLFKNLISWLQKSWHTITVVTTKFDKKLPSYEKINETYEIYRVGHNRYDFMLFSIPIWYKLAKKHDIIHTTTYTASIPAWIVGTLTKKKVVITVHEIFGHLWKRFVWAKWPFYKLFESFIFLFPFKKYICVSNYTRNMLHEVEWISLNKMITIYNWIDYSVRSINNNIIQQWEVLRKKYNLEDKYIWFFFWRPWISKWLEYFIHAIPSIIQKIPHFMAYLLVAKDDNARYEHVRAIVQGLNVGEYVIWWDKVPYNELSWYISMSDVTIIPSLTEWFWFAAVEAATVWKPVIVTIAWSLPEVISWKVAFVKPWDATDIASKVFEVYQWKYETIPQKTFSRDDNIAKTLSVYDELLWK